MTTAIALETGRGDLSLALAFGMIHRAVDGGKRGFLSQPGTQRKLMDLFWAWREKHFLPINVV
jgi:DNA polymerase IIIc chi subunit